MILFRGRFADFQGGKRLGPVSKKWAFLGRNTHTITQKRFPRADPNPCVRFNARPPHRAVFSTRTGTSGKGIQHGYVLVAMRAHTHASARVSTDSRDALLRPHRRSGFDFRSPAITHVLTRFSRSPPSAHPRYLSRLSPQAPQHRWQAEAGAQEAQVRTTTRLGICARVSYPLRSVVRE